jgi:hypothetical protein
MNFNKNICKYCHLEGHVIDDCPTIICKICKEIGHAQWLCTKKNKSKNIVNTPIINNYNYVIEKNNNNIVQKDIDYYKKLLNKNWGDLIELN